MTQCRITHRVISSSKQSTESGALPSLLPIEKTSFHSCPSGASQQNHDPVRYRVGGKRWCGRSRNHGHLSHASPNLLVPQDRSCTQHFHLKGVYCAHPTLWLAGSDNAPFLMSSLGQRVTRPTVKGCFHQGAVACQELSLKEKLFMDEG